MPAESRTPKPARKPSPLDSEDHFQCELEFSRIPSTLDLTKGRRVKIADRYIKVRTIEKIESLGPELQTHPLDYGDDLEKTKIDIGIARSRQDISSSVSELAYGIRNESTCIEKFLDLLAS